MLTKTSLNLIWTVEAPLWRPIIPMEKSTLLHCVQDLFTWASYNLSPKESAKVKEVLVEHKDTTFHDPVKHLNRTNKIEHKIWLYIVGYLLDEGKSWKLRFSWCERKATSERAKALGVTLTERKMARSVFVWTIVNSMMQHMKMHIRYLELITYWKHYERQIYYLQYQPW